MVELLPARAIEPGEDGQVLVTEDGVAKWAVGSGGGPGGATTLGSLSDVVVNSPATGQTIRWDGSQFVNALLTVLDIDGLDEVLAQFAGISHTHPEYAEADHEHDAADVTSGVFSTARLGTGTADEETILYGDGTWKPAGSGGGGLTAEEVRDLVGSLLVEGANVTITVDDGANTIEIAAADTNTTDVEVVRDTVAAMLVEGTGIDLTYDDGADTLTVTATAGAGGLDAEQVRDLIAATLVEGDGITITHDDGADTITIDATGGGGGGATVLADLTDVDDTTPVTGQALVWDGDSWVPTTLEGGGGPEVGTWENNLQTNFVYPTPVETDLQSSPPTLPTTRPAVANIERTVASGDLVTNTGDDVGHDSLMVIYASMRCVGGTTGNPQVEAGIWKASTGIETTSGTAQIGHPGSGTRQALMIISPLPIEVGDKVRMRIWSSNGANYRLDWWAYRSISNHWGRKRDDTRVALWRDVVLTGNFSTFAPSTVLSNAPTTWAAGSDQSRAQWLDNGAVIGTNATPTQQRSLLADPSSSPHHAGIMTNGDGVSQTSMAAIVNSSTVAQILGINSAAQMRGDRLYVPIPIT